MELAVQTREDLGKKLNALRKSGLIPAEFYGHGMKNEHLAVKAEEFRKVFKEAGENTIVNLSLGNKKLPALIYDVKEDPTRGEIMSIDFYGVRMDEKINAKVPVIYLGEAPAIKEKGGVLNETVHELEVSALPGDLPHSFEIDITSLKEIGDTLYVKDLKIPKGVEVLLEGELPLIGIATPRVEEVAPVAPVDLTEVKVESEEKKAEREAEKATEEKE
ncbi:MAG: large subunit ribosomal protein L25 [Parcubacteria group bacterium LiPW_15]|nr:MAG: large subunit ribosomal protein L25 [Parcubacteria group bacterium LiPW_15]